MSQDRRSRYADRPSGQERYVEVSAEDNYLCLEQVLGIRPHFYRIRILLRHGFLV